MSVKVALVLLAVCILGAQAGFAPAIGYAAHAPAIGYATHAYAAPAVAYAAPVVYDDAHYSYGYLNPYGNGHVAVAQDGPIGTFSYSFGSLGKVHVF